LASTADTLGWAYYYVGAFPSAVDMLETAIKNSPENSTYHYHLGLAYQKTRDYAHAKEQLERALTLRSEPVQADKIRRALVENTGG